MIVLTRLNGTRFAINDEQIERLEDGPETVVVLVNGNRYTARESLDEVIDVIVEFRAKIVNAVVLTDPTSRRNIVETAVDASIAAFRPHAVVDDDVKTFEAPTESDPGFVRPPSLLSTFRRKQEGEKQ